MTDLTERLRKGRLVKAAETISLTVNGEEIEASTGEVRELCHPDALEAATTLETLTQEVERLREALEGIVTGDVERVVAHVWRADGKPSKLDQCAHDVQINHDCPSCIEDHARKALGGGDEQ